MTEDFIFLCVWRNTETLYDSVSLLYDFCIHLKTQRKAIATSVFVSCEPLTRLFFFTVSIVSTVWVKVQTQKADVRQLAQSKKTHLVPVESDTHTVDTIDTIFFVEVSFHGYRVPPTTTRSDSSDSASTYRMLHLASSIRPKKQ